MYFVFVFSILYFGGCKEGEKLIFVFTWKKSEKFVCFLLGGAEKYLMNCLIMTWGFLFLPSLFSFFPSPLFPSKSCSKPFSIQEGSSFTEKIAKRGKNAKKKKKQNHYEKDKFRPATITAYIDTWHQRIHEDIKHLT